MSAYTAPLKDMRFVLNELAGLSEVAKLPGYEEATPDTVDAILEEAAKFASGVLDPLNRSGDEEGSVWKDGNVRTPKGLQGGLQALLRRRLERAVARSGVGRAGVAEARFDAGHRNDHLGQHVVFALPDAHAGRDRGDAGGGHGATEEDFPAEDVRRQLDRHDESHRAAGGLGPRAGAHQGRARRAITTASAARRSSSPSASTT